MVENIENNKIPSIDKLRILKNKRILFGFLSTIAAVILSLICGYLFYRANIIYVLIRNIIEEHMPEGISLFCYLLHTISVFFLDLIWFLLYTFLIGLFISFIASYRMKKDWYMVGKVVLCSFLVYLIYNLTIFLDSRIWNEVSSKVFLQMLFSFIRNYPSLIWIDNRFSIDDYFDFYRINPWIIPFLFTVFWALLFIFWLPSRISAHNILCSRNDNKTSLADNEISMKEGTSNEK